MYSNNIIYITSNMIMELLSFVVIGRGAQSICIFL